MKKIRFRPSPSLKMSALRSLLVTVPDTFAVSYEHMTSQNAGAASGKAARNKTNNYAAISQSHHFVPIAVETAGSWHRHRITAICSRRQDLSSDTRPA